LGNEQWKNAIEALEAMDFAEAAKITLNYYDKAYDKGLSMKETKEIFRFSFEEDDINLMAKTLIEEADKKYGRN
jgi:hypothetical protein